MVALINRLLQIEYVGRSDAVFPARVTALPDVIDELLKRLGGKPVWPDIDQVSAPVETACYLFLPCESGDNSFYYGLRFKTFRLLPEFCRDGWKGKTLVQGTDKAGKSNTMDGAHQVADILRFANLVYRPPGLIEGIGGVFEQFFNAAAKPISEEKISLQKQHIRIDVKKTESHLPVALGFKRQGHV